MDKEIEQQLIDEAIIHFYPGTNIVMQPGDVLYSHKYAFSSFLVGHTAIVGVNFRIYHVNRWAKIGHSDSIPLYLSRHKKGERLTILRHHNQVEAKRAASWAMQHFDFVKHYTYERDLQNIEKNYCSKFTWQAYYFGNNQTVDLCNMKRRSKKAWIMPGTLYHKFQYVGHFKNPLYN